MNTTRELALPVATNAIINLTVQKNGDYKMVLEFDGTSSEFSSTEDYVAETPFGIPNNLWNDVQGKIVELQTELEYNAMEMEKEHWV